MGDVSKKGAEAIISGVFIKDKKVRVGYGQILASYGAMSYVNFGRQTITTNSVILADILYYDTSRR